MASILKQTKWTSTAPIPQALVQVFGWHIFIQKEVSKQNLLQHINSVDPAIHIIVKDNKEGGYHCKTRDW